MPYAIEMFFDEPGEANVCSLWQALAAAGAPSLLDSGSRPHVSLAVADLLDVPTISKFLSRFAAGITPFQLSLSSIGLFPGSEPVAFLAPKVTPELLALHTRFASEFTALAEGVWQHYLPAVWVPHCTLSMRVRPEQLSTVLAASLPIVVTVSGLSLVEFSPVRELYSTPFPNVRNG